MNAQTQLAEVVKTGTKQKKTILMLKTFPDKEGNPFHLFYHHSGSQSTNKSVSKKAICFN